MTTIRARYSTKQPVVVPQYVRDELGRWFTDRELQWAEERFRAAHPSAAEPATECQVLYLRPRTGR